MDSSTLANLLEASLNPSTQKIAEEHIHKLSETPGFTSSLLETVLRKLISDHLRLVAAVVLKNIVENKWRGRSKGGLQDEEKGRIKEMILSIVDEPSRQITIQLALIVGKISRCDFPASWPNLLQTLFQMIKQGNQITRLHGLLYLHHVQLALRSRSIDGRRALRQAAPEIFHFTCSLWREGFGVLNSYIVNRQNNPQNDNLNTILAEAETINFSLKVLHGLLLQGFSEWTEANGVLPFLVDMLQSWNNLIEIRKVMGDNNPLSSYCTKFENRYGKIMVETFDNYASCWVPVLNHYLTFCYQQLKTNNSSPEKFYVNCMIFIKACITTREYEPSQLGWNIIQSFLQDQNIVELTSLLIEKYMVMTTEDLNDWSSDPEMFVHEEDMDAWNEKKRPMSENLFLTLLRDHKKVMAPVIFQMIQATTNATTLPGVLLRDAAFNTIAIGSTELYDLFQYPSWFMSCLVPELTKTDLMYKIIHRRIALIVGQWCSAITEDVRDNIYSAIVTLLNNPDLVVSLTAASSLALIVKDLDFQSSHFSKYVDVTLSRLFRIISSCIHDETKLKILDIFSSLLESIGEHVNIVFFSSTYYFKAKGHVNLFLEITSNLWQKSEKSRLLKASILQLLVNLVTSMKEYEFQELLCPVLKYSVNPESEDSLYILAEGLELWRATIRSAKQLSNGLLELFPQVTKVVTYSYEHIIVSIDILSNYILLGQAPFMEKYAQSVIGLLQRVIGDVTEEATPALMKPLEILIIQYPTNIPSLIEPILIKVLNLLFNPNESLRSKVFYVSVFSRLQLHNMEYFLKFMQNASLANPNVLLSLFELSLEIIENMVELGRKKATIFALLSLSTIPAILKEQAFTQNLDSLIMTAIGVIQEEEEDTSDIPYLVRPDESFDDDQELYPSEVRGLQLDIREWRKLYLRDPVNQITLRNYLREKLNILQNLDSVFFQALMQKIDLGGQKI